MDPRNIERHAETFDRLRREVGRVVVGQEKILDRLLAALVCEGHVLLEGVPGIAKTTLVRTLAQAIGVKFARISFTPDLLPADVVGTEVYNPKDGTFSPKKGPVFANLLLADEINRAPAKVQSALLEAMQERQVTIGQETYPLPDPFLVLATQNPIEQEGTYPLPEAQTDRFMLKVRVTYPTPDEERRILDLNARTDALPPPAPVVSPDAILRARATLNDIYVDDKIKDYILSLVFATRDPAAYHVDALVDNIRYGASPRATLFLTMASRCQAFLEGRGYVTPQDVKTVAMDVLRHRVILTYEAEAEEQDPESVVQEILNTVRVP
jgi:MoxR-like ATPase